MGRNEKELINPDPFHGEWINRFYHTVMYGPYEGGTQVLVAMLIDRYIQRFNEIHKLNLPCMDENFFQHAVCREGKFFFSEDIMEWVMEYRDKNYDLFLYVADMGGFEVLQLPLENNYIYPPKGKEIRNYLKRQARDIPRVWRPVFWEAANCIWESGQYLEGSDVIFLKNVDIWWYKTFCRKYMKRISPRLQQEKQVIDGLLDNLKYPLIYVNEYKERFSDENYFIFFDIGSDGYNELDFSVLNYQWVFSCLAFGSLMKQFKVDACEMILAIKRGDAP